MLGSQLSEGRTEVDKRIERVCLRYDELADASSEYFRTSSMVVSLIIGLGGPFWFDAVQGLMRATQMLRGRAPAADSQSAEQRRQERQLAPTKIFEQHVEPEQAKG